MDFTDAVTCDGVPSQAAAVNPFLDSNMCFRFELQVAFARVLAIVVFEGTLDIDRMSVVPFDQVTVVAVHRPHEVGERGH